MESREDPLEHLDDIVTQGRTNMVPPSSSLWPDVGEKRRVEPDPRRSLRELHPRPREAGAAAPRFTPRDEARGIVAAVFVIVLNLAFWLGVWFVNT